MKNNHVSPVLRFTGFTADWEQRKLSDLAEIVGGGTPDTNNPTYWDGDIDWYAPAEMEGQRYATGSVRKITELGLQKSSAKMLPANRTVLFTSRAGIGKMAILQRPACTNQGFQSMVLKDEIDPYFIYSMGGKIKDMAEGIASGSTFLEISGKMLGNLEVMIPTIEEQKEIASFFRGMDDLIALHQQQYDRLLQTKKAMLLKMFPRPGKRVPEIRFAGFTADWEQHMLGELANIKDSARIPNAEWSDSGVPYIRASDITNEDISGVLFINLERYDYYKSRTGAPAQGDVLFNGGGEIGKAFFIVDNKPIYVQGGAVLYAQTSKSTSLNGQYLKTFFETSMAQNYIDIVSAGGTMKHFTLKPSQEMPVQLPTMSEQIQIGSFFHSVDNLITLHQGKLNILSNLKKAMLQKMFPVVGRK